MAKGFNKGPQMGQGGMMQQLQKMQKQMEEAQAKLAVETVTATAGGGAIKVTLTGDQKCKSVEINPDLLKDMDAEMLQDLVLTAVNGALDANQDRSISIPSNSLPLAFGSLSVLDSAWLYQGAIDDARVYDRALDATEVAALANPHVVLASGGANGTITPVGAVTVFDHGDQVFSIHPDPTYQVAALVEQLRHLLAIPCQRIAGDQCLSRG